MLDLDEETMEALGYGSFSEGELERLSSLTVRIGYVAKSTALARERQRVRDLPPEERAALAKARKKAKQANTAEWQAANRLIRSAYQALWRKRQPEKFKASQRKYLTSEKGKAMRAKMWAKYYAANKERIIAARKARKAQKAARR